MLFSFSFFLDEAGRCALKWLAPSPCSGSLAPFGFRRGRAKLARLFQRLTQTASRPLPRLNLVRSAGQFAPRGQSRPAKSSARHVAKIFLTNSTLYLAGWGDVLERIRSAERDEEGAGIRSESSEPAANGYSSEPRASEGFARVAAGRDFLSERHATLSGTAQAQPRTKTEQHTTSFGTTQTRQKCRARRFVQSRIQSHAQLKSLSSKGWRFTTASSSFNVAKSSFMRASGTAFGPSLMACAGFG